MSKVLQAFIRSSAFLRREVVDILRQPRLVLTLVLGPFLILLLFGLGYRQEARALRTLFVADEDSALSREIEEYAQTLGPQLVFVGVTTNAAEALYRLERGEIDLVAVAPEDAYETIRSNQQATFTLYHREIDPFQVEYVNYFGQIYVDEVNRRVLQQVTAEGQSDAADVQSDVAEARGNVAALRGALEQRDEAAARREQRNLDRNLDDVSLAVGASLGLLGSVQGTLGPAEDNPATELLQSLANIRQNADRLGDPAEARSERIRRAAEVERDLAELETSLQEFRSISPFVLVSPFRSEARNVAPLQPTVAQFFAPGVLALLLQHLTTTFAALSIVSERSVGTVELFRVSPLSAGEALLGKYLSYLLFGGLIALALTLLLVFILDVPMLGSPLEFALVVAALLFSSAGIGFVISLLAQTESQAVEYTMIVLLTSVFFSGFILGLELLIEPMRVLSWALPTTYGIVLLRDVTLRGLPVNWFLLGGLAAIGLGLALLSWLMLRRLMARE